MSQSSQIETSIFLYFCCLYKKQNNCTHVHEISERRSIQCFGTWTGKQIEREWRDDWPRKHQGVCISQISLYENPILENRRKRWETLEQKMLESARKEADRNHSLTQLPTNHKNWGQGCVKPISAKWWMTLNGPIRDDPQEVVSSDVIFDKS